MSHDECLHRQPPGWVLAQPVPRHHDGGELIDILSQYDEDQPVYIRNDNGYTYGSVQLDSVTEGEEDEDE